MTARSKNIKQKLSHSCFFRSSILGACRNQRFCFFKILMQKFAKFLKLSFSFFYYNFWRPPFTYRPYAADDLHFLLCFCVLFDNKECLFIERDDQWMNQLYRCVLNTLMPLKFDDFYKVKKLNSFSVTRRQAPLFIRVPHDGLIGVIFNFNYAHRLLYAIFGDRLHVALYVFLFSSQCAKLNESAKKCQRSGALCNK